MRLSIIFRTALIAIFLQIASLSLSAQTVTRGPYLQKGTKTSIVIRWRTSVATNSRIRIGTVYNAAGTYATIIDDASSTTEHIVSITGLLTDTKYFYSVGSTTAILSFGSTDYFFRTLPADNTTRVVRIAAFGDCGRNSATYQDNNLTRYRNYLTTNSIDAPDAWILLGDNAYTTGSDAEYTTNFFNIYSGNVLRNHKMYPALGNHDYGNNTANKTSRAMAYYSNFSTFQGGEAGGVASNKPNFYSFDVGPIHFLSIDSWGIEADGSYIGQDTTSPNTQFAWIKSDLAANTKKFTVAYWHHAPYTKSSHNSDSEAELLNIRTKFIQALEKRGVDLIITGHSHAYERGYPMKGFYTLWTTFNAATHAISTSNGKYTSNVTCPYVYNSSPAYHGTLYVVAGSTGASGGTNAGFGANGFPFAVNDGGVLYFEVQENRLDAKMIRQDGTIFDQFTIIKDVNKTTGYTIANNQSIDLTASWPQTGNYTWAPSGGTARVASVTPPINATTQYTVTDAFGCVTDRFNVTTSSTLPVSLLGYNAFMADKNVELTWATSTELNNKQFTIERSQNGRDFTAIGTVQGQVNSNSVHTYSFMDYTPFIGTSYYRLMQEDIDGNKKYLGIKRIENNLQKKFDVKVLKSTNDQLSLMINTTQAGEYTLRIFDLSGRVWYNERIQLTNGQIRKDIALKNNVYLWEVKNEKGESISRKVSIL